MLQRIIPILRARPAPPAWLPTRLVGQPEHVERVRAALEVAVASGLGHTPAGWLRELRLEGGEAFVTVAPGLGLDSLGSAEIAFDTLRRLLPDTDIFVGQART